MGHLLSFTGTDTIPAIYQLEKSYGATGLIGASVPATEHSVECMSCQGTMEGEYQHTKRLLELYPTGIVSKVSDTTDLWSVITVVLPRLKEEILARDGKLVIRPDSGNPVDIICGLENKPEHQIIIRDGKELLKDNNNGITEEISPAEKKGVIELLWDVFGGTVNAQGYKVLDSHIGAIYGDSITIDRARQICERLKAKGFASSNIVFGIGSYTYQYNTRDTFGFAMKATYGEVNGVGREIFKDPITDDGTKKSKKGLLGVFIKTSGDGSGGDILCCEDQLSWEQEKSGHLKTVFLNGTLVKETTLEEIRERLKNA
jgi:nicotinamide phosphoribosyltransferase